jgi:RNA polymerase sigma-70 factor (ECF subfamily)
VPEPAAPARESGERADELAAALSSLGAEHRAVVVLRYLLDYTPGEIAELLDLPRGTVNSRLRRGLDRLEEVLR